MDHLKVKYEDHRTSANSEPSPDQSPEKPVQVVHTMPRRRYRQLEEEPPQFSNLWGCLPAKDPLTLMRFAIVWGGTALVLAILYVVMFPPNTCIPGTGDPRCPGVLYVDYIKSINAARTATTTTATTTFNRYWPNHDDDRVPKSVVPNGITSVAKDFDDIPAASITKAVAPPRHEIRKRLQPIHTDPMQAPEDAEDPSESVTLPASVFITFTPSERPKTTTDAPPTPPPPPPAPPATTTRAKGPVSAPPPPPPPATTRVPVSAPPPPPPADTTKVSPAPPPPPADTTKASPAPPPPPAETTKGPDAPPPPPVETPGTPPTAPLPTPTIPDGDGYLSTTTVRQFTTIHVHGPDSTGGATATKASGGGVIHVPGALGGIVVVFMAAILGI